MTPKVIQFIIYLTNSDVYHRFLAPLSQFLTISWKNLEWILTFKTIFFYLKKEKKSRKNWIVICQVRIEIVLLGFVRAS